MKKDIDPQLLKEYAKALGRKGGLANKGTASAKEWSAKANAAKKEKREKAK